MKISAINNSILYKINPIFKSTTSFYKTTTGQEIGSNSWMFREDINWQDSAEFEFEHFKDRDSVRVVQFASSDGSEAYTKIISLLKQNEKEAQKFLPIEAYDINPAVVNAANSGFINFINNDFIRAQKANIDLKDFFTEVTTTLNIKNDNMFHFFDISTTTYKVSEKLKNNVKFYHKDMFKVLEESQDGELPLVLCRNLFSYLDDIDAKKAINLLGKKMLDGGLLYLGERDFDKHNIRQWLNENCFIPAKYDKNGKTKTLKNVFIKVLKKH